MRICEPRWIRPELCRFGDAVTILVGGACDTQPIRAQLENDDVICALAIERIEPAPSIAGVTLHGRVPETTAPGLWALRVQCGDAEAHMPNAVQVHERFPERYTFVHTSDIHIWNPDKQGGFYDRTRALELMVEQINELAPEFVINTGDLISRYRRSNTDPLGPAPMREQTVAVKQRLLELKMAMFVTPGNHDVAFSWARQAWAEHMGFPPGKDRDDFSFDFGRDHFTVLDASRRYDDQTCRATDHPFTDAQLDWLVRDVPTSARVRILAFHYDYRRVLEPLIERLNIAAVLYGHSNKATFVEPQPEGFIEGLLAGAYAFQLVHVEDGRLRIEPGPKWHELDPAAAKA